ncbi:uncharacterized protein ELE39_001021 [Cryptosporidium sp. chipmunk genotype I]|uniref:uncharacterized protein n=1 Tax=Cryptosporidium sp. chipmunk genotype I TaxID=1280935 RepID=UPI00351A4579|nr:hypothetical protein ELE39_001021 [Cryptosporidium sp. chipmunk genotype I]
MQDEVNVSHFRRGAEAIVNQLDEICGGNNPKIRLSSGEIRSRPNGSNTLSNILQQYSDSVTQGEGVGYIGIEWKGPFPLHNTIIQHIKRVQLLIGKSPSLVYGVIPNIKYGYVGLENVLYIFPIEENIQKSLRRESSVGSSTDRRTITRMRTTPSNFDQEFDDKPTNDESILTIVFQFSIKNMTGAFPRIGIFASDVEYLLCVITERSIHLLALKFDNFIFAADNSQSSGNDGIAARGAGLIRVPIMKIGDKDIGMLQCSLPGSHTSKFHSLHGTLDGRFFFLEENSSNIHELVYQSTEGWITPYCYIHSHQIYSSFTKELFLKYTFLRFMPRSFSIKKISLAPCGFMAILDTSQNIYLAAYLNDISSKETLSNILPWGRTVNSLGYWASNLDIGTFFLPTDWDNYVSSEFQNSDRLLPKTENLNLENFSLGLFNNDSKRFSSPSSLKVVAMMRKKDIFGMFSKIPGNPICKKNEDLFSMQSIKAEYRNQFDINDLQLFYTSDYNLSLSLFTNNGTRLQFQCSKRLNEVMPSIQSVINGFRFEPETLFGSPKKKIQTEKALDQSKSSLTSYPSNDLTFGFWLTYVLPTSNSCNESSNISNSYYRNGLTIITRNITSSAFQNVNSSTDFSRAPNKNICQVELRLFSSLPADIGIASSSNFGNRALNNQNSPALNLRYNGNFSSSGQRSKGEPIIIDLEEQIKAIHEFTSYSEDINCSDSPNNSEDFPILAGKKSRASPNVILEYGGNPLGNNNRQHDLLGWVKDRYIVFVGETRYFFLVLKWNGLQQIIGASGLFMQLIQFPLSSNANLNQFRRLVHPEDSFLIDGHLSLTSPWVEALSGAIAFDLRSVLEFPPFYKHENNINLLFNPKTLEICLSKLQSLMNILSRSQNIIGNEVFDPSSLPCICPINGRSFDQILSEELNKDHNSHLKDSTTFLLKSLAYIINFLLQLFRFLTLFAASSAELKDLTFRTFEKHDQNLLSEMPILYLIVSNTGVSQIKKFVESFSVNVLEAISNQDHSIIEISFVTQIKLIYKKIGWVLNAKSSKIMKRLALVADLSVEIAGYQSNNYLKEASMIERISSRDLPPIGGFSLPPFKYWEYFQADPSQNEYFREIFSSLLLKPFHKTEEATLLLLDCISHFEHLLTEQLNMKQNFIGSDTQEEFNSQNYNFYFLHIEQIIKAWSDSLCETFVELFDGNTSSSEINTNSMKSLILLTFSNPLKTLFSSCFNKKVLESCVVRLLKDILPVMITRFADTLSRDKKGNPCYCQTLLENLTEICRYDSLQKTSHSEKSLLGLVATSLSKPFKSLNTNQHLKEYNWDHFTSFLFRIAGESNYSPYYFVISAIYLLDDSQEISSGYIKCINMLSELSLNKNVLCGSRCRNVRARIGTLKLIKEICISGVGKGLISTDMDVSQFFSSPLTESYFDRNKFQMEHSFEYAISNMEGIVSLCSNLQLPLLEYIEKMASNQENFNQHILILSTQILTCSELNSLINSSLFIEPFLIVSTLLESSVSIKREGNNLEDLCSQISDYFLQILIPPKGHVIYSHVSDLGYKFQLPILNRFFGFNGCDNFSESIHRLLEFIQTPLLNITGSSLLGSLSVAPKTYLSVGLSNQEIFEKYDLFQQIYSITAIFEFANYYISAVSQNIDPYNLCHFPTCISIQLWNKCWSVPYDLLFDVYISLLESSMSSNSSSDPFMLIFNRIKALEPPNFKFDIASNYHDSFILHLRKCIIGILTSWIKNRQHFPLSQSHSCMANDFVISTLAYIQNTYSPDHSQKLTSILENLQIELRDSNL